MDLSDTLKASTSGETIHAHLVAGDDGREVDGLARWLVDEGVALTRSLPTGQRPTHAVSRADPGHSPASIPRSARCLIYGPGVSRQHPDRLVAVRRGLPEVGCHEMIRDLLATRSGIAVAGRRLGGVAAAMIGWTLDRAGLDPTVLLRRPMPQLGGPGRSGRGRHAVVDITGVLDARLAGCPGPETAILLDVEGLSPVETAALERIIAGVGGTVLTGPRHQAISGRSTTCRFESVSLDRGSVWWGADLKEERGRFRFRAFHRGRFVAEVRLRVPGRGSVVSALAAVAVCLRADLPTGAIIDGLEDFAGIARGFQSRGSYRGVTLVDDDATEPAEVAEAVGLARAAFGRRRLWTVFGPTRSALAETAGAMVLADRVLVVGAAVDSGGWAGMLVEAGVDARSVDDAGEAIEHLDRNIEPGDVLLTLGAGDVGTIADAFLRRIPGDYQGR